MPAARRARPKGQVVVELMLILPVFFMMIFFVMEMGSLAFQTILAHHAAYECARIGSLVAGKAAQSGGGLGYNEGVARSEIDKALRQMFPKEVPEIKLNVEQTGSDPQVAGHMNCDLVVTLTYRAYFIFPLTQSVMTKMTRTPPPYKIVATVQMPIEKPFFE